ncbi:multiple sugar transport system permease protein [Deinobacterium chartae]|uniref:Multiple sugar transport system permease protein n=1 Tax=Deinobacterium chartae TaxID=521158 RepID=A0A841HZ64_9DEIO|nr:carbohydrate ABC transporter permease [Deinobacterium chartae]MBB6097500.1 multiple sugar transport system permease protein [Deinobacterium chartae]
MTTLPAAPHARVRRGPDRSRVATYAALLLATVATLVPFLMMLMVSLKPAGIDGLGEAFSLSGLSLESYHRIFASANVIGWTVNSLIYSVVSVVLVLLFASMAGYAFAKKRFPGKEGLFWTFLAMLMVPGQITLIPLFIILSAMNGIDTHWGLIIPTVANAQAVFLMRQFIAGIPDELIEAARIDGASEWRIYWQIILPQTGPILATLGTFVFLWHWNDFLWPLLVAQGDSMRTLTVGLAALQTQNVNTSEVMAGTALSFIPTFLVFLLLQRYFVRSIMTSGLK